MTELQIGLIGLGATAVVGVLAYNKWQEYRQRKLVEAVLRPAHEDLLLAERPKTPASEPELRDELPAVAGERREPVFADVSPGEVLAEPGPSPVYADDPPLATATPDAEPAIDHHDQELPELPAGLVPGTLLDPRLEFIVAMELVDPVPGTQIVYAQQDALQHLGKPVHWVAFNERTREWERIAPDSEVPVRRIRVGLQLVDRTGLVAEADVFAFSEAMYALADQLMAVADMPSSQVLEQAA